MLKVSFVISDTLKHSRISSYIYQATMLINLSNVGKRIISSDLNSVRERCLSMHILTK